MESSAILLVVLRSCVQTLALVSLSGIIVACSTSQESIVVPEISVAVKLSETAQKKLQAMHESVLGKARRGFAGCIRSAETYHPGSDIRIKLLV
jgi:hypothetical protein